jgi:hypothetical protein
MNITLHSIWNEREVKFDVTILHMYRIKVKVKFSLDQATKAQRGIRGIALLFL